MCARNPNLSFPEYLWQGKVSVRKVLVLIKVVPVKNDYFVHQKFDLHRYQQINGFLYWRSFCWKKYGAYISHELIVRLIPTWIWCDLLTVSQIWLSNHQLSLNFVTLKQHGNLKASRCRELFWCYCVYFDQLKYRNNESKSNPHEIFFW